ncbi:MAG TPA: metalloregulator ArsR/SmtB family transcription factor [Chloroflexota bacterium]|nr:metalloregulator ArsR/SmtB family transcription factor [Chloroflexota bacterium]
MDQTAGMPRQTALRFFKALADESRLRLVGILAGGERSVDELTAQLELRGPTVSHHLAHLRALGLVTMRAEGNVHVYRLEVAALHGLSRDVFALDRMVALADDVEVEAWRRKVLRDFFAGQVLKEIPASRKKRAVILEWLANRFQEGTRYREVEVNTLLRQHHPDPATLRRELVGAGLLRREQSVYWRPAPV